MTEPDFQHYIGIITFAIAGLLVLIWFTVMSGNSARRAQTKALKEIATILRDLNDKMDALEGIGNGVEKIWFELVRDKRTDAQRTEDAMWIDSQRPLDKP
jgi:hypothetical protein